ncbi:RmlC-like cupin domain-containing protein [Biscogniauxia mediterranea]|nr:RmlC-like cupin domain-containing protein [Biscogniauxia mediterranea]
MAQQRVFQLSGTCNQYPWGKKGSESLAAKLCAATPGTDFKVEHDKNYSELWFGDYNDFPARKLDSGELLSEVLARNKERLLGKKVIERFDAQLPYLPKILSIAKALPLQLHPNKELASKLHAQDPDSFTDPNHKPEIAVALSKFEIFAGFKPLDEVAPLFELQPLQQFNPQKPDKWSDETLRDVTRNLLKADLDTVKKVQRALSEVPKTEYGEAAYILDLLPRLQAQYGPEDAGSLVALLCMNYLVLNAGDAVFIPADGVHAYLAGDIVECMARSNNVLNVGFCPPADRNNADLFADTLTFKAHSKADVILASQKSTKSKNGKTVVYRPPMSEFDMLKVDLGAGDREEISASEGPGVMIVTSGAGVMHADGSEFQLEQGYIFFVGPGVPVKWESRSGLQIHMAVI